MRLRPPNPSTKSTCAWGEFARVDVAQTHPSSLRASAKRERVLRGLVGKSEHEWPGPARDDAFWSLISRGAGTSLKLWGQSSGAARGLGVGVTWLMKGPPDRLGPQKYNGLYLLNGLSLGVKHDFLPCTST